jgi:hypothetical protein
MKFCIPMYPIVEARDAAEAEAIRVKLEAFLKQPLIVATIRAQGVPMQSATVDKPYVVAEPARATGGQRR